MIQNKLTSILLILITLNCVSAQVFDESNILSEEENEAIAYYIRSVADETSNNIELHTIDIGQKDNTFIIIYSESVIKLYDTTNTKLNTEFVDSISSEITDSPPFFVNLVLSEYKLKHNLIKKSEINLQPTTTTLCGKDEGFIRGQCCRDKNKNSVCDSKEDICRSPNKILFNRCCLDTNNNNLCDDIETSKTPENITKINNTHSLDLSENITFETNRKGENKPTTTTVTTTSTTQPILKREPETTYRQTTTTTTIITTTTIQQRQTTTTQTKTPTTIKTYESKNTIKDPTVADKAIEYIEGNKTTVALGIVITAIIGIALLWLIGGEEDN